MDTLLTYADRITITVTILIGLAALAILVVRTVRADIAADRAAEWPADEQDAYLEAWDAKQAETNHGDQVLADATDEETEAEARRRALGLGELARYDAWANIPGPVRSRQRSAAAGDPPDDDEDLGHSVVPAGRVFVEGESEPHPAGCDCVACERRRDPEFDDALDAEAGERRE